MTPSRLLAARRRCAQALLVAALATAAVGCASDVTGKSAERPASSDSPASASAGESSSTNEETDASGDSGALEEFLDAARPQVEKEVERYSDIYRDFSLEAEGSSTIVYRYVFKDALDPDVAKEQLEKSRATLESMATSSIFPEMEKAGIESPAAKWIYVNPDGQVVSEIEVRS